MTHLKGERLYVHLSASQVRRRLEGLGYGVRKVQSAGRNRAVIIHTATGEHFRELWAICADAAPSTREDSLDVPIENVRNLSHTSATWLRGIGIATRADLERMGALAAFRRVRQRQPKCTLNLLWALVAGLEDRDWRELSSESKQKWRAELES